MINTSPETGKIDIRNETFQNFECLHEHIDESLLQ